MVSNCEPSSNIKYKFADKKRAAASLRKEDSLRNTDIKPAVGTDLAEEEHANSPDGAIAEEDCNESTEETSDILPEESSKKKTEGTHGCEILNIMIVNYRQQNLEECLMHIRNYWHINKNKNKHFK